MFMVLVDSKQIADFARPNFPGRKGVGVDLFRKFRRRLAT
jgi:hypothetical protein